MPVCQRLMRRSRSPANQGPAAHCGAAWRRPIYLNIGRGPMCPPVALAVSMMSATAPAEIVVGGAIDNLSSASTKEHALRLRALAPMQSRMPAMGTWGRCEGGADAAHYTWHSSASTNSSGAYVREATGQELQCVIVAAPDGNEDLCIHKCVYDIMRARLRSPHRPDRKAFG